MRIKSITIEFFDDGDETPVRVRLTKNPNEGSSKQEVEIQFNQGEEMPVISFTPKDKMLAVTLEAGYYPFTIQRIDGPKASGSGKSINWFFDFSVDSGKFEGKSISVAFTSGSESSSILGSMAWMPTAYMRQVYAAVKNVPVADVPDTFDTDLLLNQKLDGKVEVNTGDAGLFNTISQFLPRGKGAAAGKVPF